MNDESSWARFDTAQAAVFYDFLSKPQQDLFDAYVALQLQYRQHHGFNQTNIEAGQEHAWICSQRPELNAFMQYFSTLTMQIVNAGSDGASLPELF